jgi:hypothetical protein
LRDFDAGANRYPAQVWNINNAARNLVEIIANAARDETEAPSAKVRIYTIGMGALVTLPLGTRGETSASILQRVANDTVANGNPDFNPNQLQGAYYYAQTAADVAAAFQALQNQIVRLTKYGDRRRRPAWPPPPTIPLGTHLRDFAFRNPFRFL